MSPEEKEIYEKKAKEWNEGNKGKPNAPKKKRELYSSQGVPLSVIEKENQEKEAKKNYMKNKIKHMVEEAFLDNGTFALFLYVTRITDKKEAASPLLYS